MKTFHSIILVSALLAACGSTPPSSGPGAPSAALQFVDLQSFDHDMAGSLSAQLPQVNVAFYDQITPSALPERVQTWMAAVESGGGTVKVVPPPSSVTAKNPFLLLSAISSIWSASKVVKEASTASQFNAAKSYDAQILLRANEQGQSLVDRIIFTQRKN